MNVSSIVNKPAYTDKGNQYNKFRGGKIVGAAALPAAYLIRDIAKGTCQGLAEIKGGKGKVAVGYAAGFAILAAIGTGIGAIVDACVNGSRRNKADEAAPMAAQSNDLKVFTTQG